MRLLIAALATLAAPPGGDAIVQPGTETHVVVPGDTLWDLTAKYLNNPWYWPKVWAYNPQLSNPHFIYPGTVVRFIPGGEETPARIEASSSREIPPDEQESAPVAMPSHQGKGNEVTVSGNRPLTYNASRGMIVQTVQLVTPKELQEAGELTQAFDDKQMLSTYDVVFLKYKKDVPKPQIGQPLIIYKLVQEVEHPVTGKDFGYLTQITGQLEVTATDPSDELVTAKVVKTFDPIERGQYVAAQKGPLIGELIETPNTTKLEGVILTGEYRSKRLLGQFHYVFIDRGTKDGVKNGNHFTVLRNKDYFRDVDGELIPTQSVGKIVVVDAKETASLSIVMNALVDLHPGDRVLMK
jgi:hypothetical protein